MRLRAIIIDDEKTGIETLRFLIEKYTSEVKIVAECTEPEKARQLIEDYMPNIVFLDISMPNMNGFELLESLEWTDFKLIFTTAHKEHALKALKVKAIDYLLKPIDNNDLRFAIDKVKEQLSSQQETKFDYTLLNKVVTQQGYKLGIHSKEGVEYIDPLDIVCLESKSNYTMIYLNNNKTILSPKTLKDFDRQLCFNHLNFMRVHHSFVINLRQILRYLKDDEIVLMNNAQKVPLAKSRKENFFRWLDV